MSGGGPAPRRRRAVRCKSSRPFGGAVGFPLPSLPLCALLCLSAFPLLLTLARVAYTGRMRFVFMAWNLFLAWVPLLVGRLLLRWPGLPRPLVLLGLALWLGFLPNAPYLCTDLIHLYRNPIVPLWYDLAMLLGYALAGLALCLASLADIERGYAARLNPRIRAWVAPAILYLVAFGVYLGRFLRWNSWDVLAEPAGLLADLAQRFSEPAEHPGTWGFTLVFGSLLWLLYRLAAKLLKP